jgi:hypothetical protein
MPAEELGVMSENAIEKALEAVRTRVSRGERERTELDRTIATAREEQRLLERLLALRRGGLPACDGKPMGLEHHNVNSVAASETRHTVLEAVIHELETAGRALHISELMRLLRDKNVPVPGLGTQANLITYLRRDERVVRPSRGMYGLASWGLENMTAPARKRRRRKRMRSPEVEGRIQA